MRILCLHNYYQWSGGEDRVFESEVELLRSRGHEVMTYTRHNRDIRQATLATALSTLWNPRTYGEIRSLIQQQRPDIMHCGNIFPLISPSAYYAARSCKVPVIQTLQNFRLLCPDSTLFRDGRHCHDCVGRRVAWPGVRHACYRGSRAATAVVAAMQTFHRSLGTWQRAVNTFVAVSAYVSETFRQAQLPMAPVVVKPNFVVRDPGMGDGGGKYALFAGRLVPEKGIEVLLEAFANSTKALKILGAGPLEPRVREVAASQANVEFLGQRSPDEVARWMQQASMLIVPSEWAEAFGLVVVEAFACGTPVLAARSGALPELVKPGYNGHLFEPGKAGSLLEALARLEAGECLRANARHSYETEFTAEVNYGSLMSIYENALERKF